ncbi:MAG: adenylate/guanylate cyclase domain-containing response regulator [Chloroflexota bacterium]
MANVLLVDDERENVSSLSRYLARRGPDWQMHVAYSEEEAFGILRATSIDVVLTDLVITKDAGGIEVLKLAKSIDPLTMVIVFTAFERKLDRYAAFEAGAFDCIQKNNPNVVAAEEILVKAKSALKFRELAKEQVATSNHLASLKRYFDPRVFDQLTKNPDLMSLRPQIVTVAFWDIRGFSKLSESLAHYPRLVSDFLREYLDAAASAIFEHEGVLDKFMGDGVLGLFGALDAPTDAGVEDARRAVAAAESLRGVFGQLLERWTPEWSLYTPQVIDVGLGCGIHTGEVLVGNVGSGARDQFTAVGPNVNFANRLEHRAGKGEIIVSASTRARLGDAFATEDAGILGDVKNIPGEFPTFAVVPPE